MSTVLVGTSAQVTINGANVSPLMIYTSASQVAMLMPSSTPTGNGTITVTYSGQTSSSAPVQVVAASFGLLTFNQGGSGPAVVTDANYPVISLTHSASPGQTLILWGTGLGKISADETQAPPQGSVGSQPTLWVGSQQASVFYWGRAGCCAGLDQINFQVPASVTGCYVPLAVQTGGTVSNYGTIAVASGGGVCSDPVGLGSAELALVASGQNLNVGALALSRSTVITNSPPAASTTTTTDSGSASFLRYTPSQLLSSSFGQAVSAGYCTVFPIHGTAAVTDPVQPLGLDAGTVEVGGSNGSKILIPVPGNKGYYNSTLGAYLDASAGPHTFNVLGGADVAPTSIQDIQSPPALAWANQASVSTVSESQGVTVNWTNASPDGYVRVTGYSLSVDQSGNLSAGAAFFCTANPGQGGAGKFTVPPSVLLSLPVSPASGSASPSGALGIRSQTARLPLPVTRGLDVGFAQTSVQVMQNVTYTP